MVYNVTIVTGEFTYMKIAIIDDLSTDRDTISTLVQSYFSIHCIHIPLVLQTFESGDIFLHTFSQNSFDIIFIDYYMDGLCGLDTAFAIREKDKSVKLIFTTASKDYAIAGYRVQASGYLIKPITLEEFTETMSLMDINKILKQQYIEIPSGYTVIKLPLKDIVYCDITGHYVQIHTINFGTQCSRMTFTELQNLLTPYPEFLMCYRGCMINMNHVTHIDDLNFHMDCGERIPFRKRDNTGILKVYSEFLFNKVRNQK